VAGGGSEAVEAAWPRLPRRASAAGQILCERERGRRVLSSPILFGAQKKDTKDAESE
jgi:hypothetical protein